MSKLKPAYTLLRVNQWIKNTFILLPLFFGLKIANIQLLLNGMYAFLGFSFLASSVYIFNDLQDVEADKLHPEKKNRPIAANKISKTSAIILIIILLSISSLIFYIKLNLLWIWILLSFYLLQNIIYSVKLKHVPIIDVTIISMGFLIRVMLGGLATGTMLTNWIMIMTFLLALFLALAKRRDDVLIFLRTGNKMRKNIDGYNLDFLNGSIAIMSAVVIVSYIMYATSPEIVNRMGPYMYATSVFVIVGILRYLQLTFVNEESGSPTTIVLKDVFLQITIFSWLAICSILLYSRSIYI